MAEKTVAKSPTMKLMKGKTPKEVTKEVEEVKESVAQDVVPTEAEDLIVKTVHEIENMKEDKALKLVPTLLDNIDHDYFRLGGVFSVIQAQGWYMDKGFDSFRSFVEADCGMAYRKAMYLIQIYNGLVESGVEWNQVKHLGWTKLKELSTILTTANVDEWVLASEGLTVLQLQELIKAQTAGENSDAPAPSSSEAKKTSTMTFKVHKDQKEVIREALDKAKHETGTEVDTVALENICLSYLGGSSKLSKIPTLAELMAGKSAEEVLGCFGDVFPDVTIPAETPD